MKSGLLITLLFVLVMSGGCSMRQAALRSVADAAAAEGSVFASEDDLELAGASIPTALKATEALLAETPEHRGLLVAAARGFTQYSYAFVQLPADELEERDVSAAYAQRVRARRLYLRARDYGLRALGLEVRDDREPGFDAVAKEVRKAGKTQADALYWAAAAWAAAIALGKDEPGLIGALPTVETMVSRVLELDPDYGSGALQTFLISFEVGRPNASPDALSRAREHFERAIAVSQDQQGAPYVALAEAIAQKQGSRAEFDRLLNHALSIEVDRFPAMRLANRVAQRRARWLLTQTELLFPE